MQLFCEFTDIDNLVYFQCYSNLTIADHLNSSRRERPTIPITVARGESEVWKKVLFVTSIALNLWFLLVWSSQPPFRCGVLIRDITVPLTKEVTITLPKGLVVRDDSPNGLAAIGTFDKNRFSITVTSDFKMVEYDVDWRAIRRPGSLYPAPDAQFGPFPKVQRREVTPDELKK